LRIIENLFEFIWIKGGVFVEELSKDLLAALGVKDLFN
jgi:hypothetical protein